MKTFLDWSAYEDAGMGDAYADIPRTGGNFAKAVAVCINSRQCERQDKGVMCPSYRVSELAEYSTGGRVRLLKAALNGQLGTAGLSDPGLAAAMDLCVSCKGCRRECENGVDMALIKVEYLAQRNAVRGLTLRARLFANLPRWLHRWPVSRRLPAWRNRLPWLAGLGQRVLGIGAKRRLPEAAAEGFKDSAATTDCAADRPHDGRDVVLFIDTFTRHFEPQIGHAALAVLRAAGYRVIVASPGLDVVEPDRPLCCGRSFLAQGMVDEARVEAQRVLATLLPHAQAGRPIVGLEPSCLLALRDDYLVLGLGDAARQVASQALLLEEFLARELTAKRLQLDLVPLAGYRGPVLVHGHCQQKAAGAMKSMRKVLKLIPGLEFELVEASCCGMAGSFGLESEHASVSLEMAEEALLPALRAAPQAPVVANGFSCRQQIVEADGRRPLHLALLLQAALGSAPVQGE